MNEQLANYHSTNDGNTPREDFQQSPGIVRILRTHEGETVADNRNKTFLLTVRHRILSIDQKVTKRNQVDDQQSEVRVLKVVTEIFVHEEGENADFVRFVVAFGALRWLKVERAIWFNVVFGGVIAKVVAWRIIFV